MDLCDAEKKAEIEKYQAMPAADLEAAFKSKTEEIEKLESDFKTFVEGLQKQYSDANEKKESQRQAVEAFEGAQKVQSEREATLAKAKQAVDEFQPQVDEVTGLLEKAKTTLTTFETGPLNTFTKYKNQVAVSDEAAPAGA